MARLKKNQMNQVMFPMVDKTDFATIESGVTASDLDSKVAGATAFKKFFGVNHGVSDAFTSGAISKALRNVRSGIFQQTLKAAECNYDQIVVWVTHPSCADQILVYETETNDDSDIHSLISDFYSDFQSRVPKRVATDSQLSDLHSDLKSFLTVMSDVLSDFYSDFQSRVPKKVATDSQLSDLHSDLRSFLVVMSGIDSDIYSALSDFQSDFGSRVPKRVATDSQLSDLHSDLRSFLVVMSGVQSDAYSGVQLLQSAFVGHTGSTASQVTDPSTVEIDGIDHDDQFNGYYFKVLGGSQVDELRLIVDTLKTPSQVVVKPAFNSRLASGIDFVIVAGNPWQSDIHSDVMSRLSDVNSDLRSFLAGMSDVLSDFYSDFQSRVPKRVATDSQLSDLHSDLRSQIGLIPTAVSVSDMSDIVSRVWAAKYTAHSLASSFGSLMSDIYSRAGGAVTVSDISDIASAVWAAKYTTHSLASSFGSLMSDIYSRAGGAVTASDISDIASAVWAAKYTVHSNVSSFGSLVRDVLSSRVSDIYSMLSDFQSDFGSRVPKRVATDSQLSDVHSDLRSQIAGITATVSASDMSDIASRVWSEKYTAVSNVKASTFGSALRLNMSRISDTQSFLVVMSDVLSDFYSDFQSRVPKRVATDSQLSDVHSDLRSQIGGITASVSASDISDIASAVWAAQVTTHSNAGSFGSHLREVIGSRVSDIYSMLSDFYSDFGSRVPKRVATDSQLSDVHSDLRSQIAGITASVSASDISDIASAVWAAKYTAHSNLSSFGSLIRDVLSSRVSDIYSLLSDFQSDFGSRVPKRVATDSQLSDVHSDLRSQIAGITASVSASDISDIASAVWAAGYVTHSNAGSFGSLLKDVHGSRLSDIYSLLSDVQSDFQSRVPKRVATDSQLSDVHSDLRSQIGGITASVSASDISDIASAVWAAGYAAHSNVGSFGSLVREVIGSRVSDIYSLLSDFYSDFGSRVPKAVATNSQLSDLHSDLRSYLTGLSAVQSDIYSNLAAGVLVGPSGLSDIESRVWRAAEGELVGVPAAGAAFGDKINWLFMEARNKRRTTASEDEVNNDAGAVIASATVAEAGGSFVRGKYA